MDRQLLRATVTTLVVTLGGTAATAADTYEISLDRPMTVGQNIEVRQEATKQRRVTAVVFGNEQLVEEREIAVRLDARAEVLEIDASGHPQRVRFDVKRCVATEHGAENDVVPRGASLIGSIVSGRTIFEREGQPVDARTQERLEMVASLAQTDLVDDAVAGPAAPHAIGESWSIDAGRAASAIRESSGLQVSRRDVSGTMSLAELTSFKGVPCLMLKGERTISNAMPGLEEFPADYEVKSSTIASTVEIMLPQDEAFPALQQKITTNLEATLAGPLNPGGPEIEMHVTEALVVSSQYLPADAFATVSQD